METETPPTGKSLVTFLQTTYPQIPKSIFADMPTKYREKLYKDPKFLVTAVDKARDLRRKYGGYKKKAKASTSKPSVPVKPQVASVEISSPFTPNKVAGSLETVQKSLLLIQIAALLDQMPIAEALQVLPMLQKISETRKG